MAIGKKLKTRPAPVFPGGIQTLESDGPPGGIFCLMRILRFTTLLMFLLSVAQTGMACILLNAISIGFGDNDGIADIASRQVAGLDTQCTTEYRLYLDGGQNMSSARRLSDGAGNFITYYLWQDSGAGVEWGSAGLGSGVIYPASPLTATGSGLVTTHPIYGTALTAGASPPGIYTDLVHVTLTWFPYGPGDILETDLPLNLNLTGSCSLDLSGLGDFGTWPAGSADLQGMALGSLSVGCTLGVNFTVGIDAGQNLQGVSRRMRNGVEFIPYVLWADGSRTTPWGDTGLTAIEPGYVETHPDPAQVGVATGGAMSFFIWGDAMINGHSAGTYSDTVTITVAW
ncbi:MAG: spore coat protein U domain-containing protein [bacterium]|nr:spore coat protein U domain-containing protein [bacterium]